MQDEISYSFIFFTITLLTSCSGKNNRLSNNSEQSTKLFAKGDTVKMLGDNIMVIYQDTKNNYWFGSWEDGLYKYNGHIIMHFTTQHGLLSNRIEEIKEDKWGNVYFNTSGGIMLFNGEDFVALRETFGIGSDWKLNPDDLWFKNSDYSGYVYRYDGNNLHKLKFPKNKVGEDYMLKHPNNAASPYAVYCIYKDSKGNIWFGTAQLGACRYNGKSFDWILEPDVTELHNEPANGVRSIAEDKDGYFWFNTEYKYQIYNNSASIISSTSDTTFYDRIKSIGCLDGKKDGVLKEYLSITKDNKNDLWITTYRHGVWRYDGIKITHYPIQSNSKNIELFFIYKDGKGEIWLGTHQNGAFKFDGQTFKKFAP